MLNTRRDIDAVLEVIGLYDRGHATGDMGMLERAFHPRANVVGYFEGELMFASRDEYLELLKNDPEPETDRAGPEIEVRSLAIVGDTAVATVASTMVGTQFTSHLSLLRQADTWQIVNGLFHAEPSEAG